MIWFALFVYSFSVLIIGIHLGYAVGRVWTTKAYVKALWDCDLTTGQVVDLYRRRVDLADLLKENGAI